MEVKSKNNKTRNTKNNLSAPLVPAKDVAELLNCSVSAVKKIRTGNRTDATLLGTKVKIFDEMYSAGTTVLIKELVRRIKL